MSCATKVLLLPAVGESELPVARHFVRGVGDLYDSMPDIDAVVVADESSASASSIAVFICAYGFGVPANAPDATVIVLRSTVLEDWWI